MRTGGERTMLQMIDVTDHVGSLLRGKAFDWIFLGKRPKRIARLNANGLVGNVGNGLGIRGVTSAKDRRSEDKEERKRNGNGDNRRNLQGNAGRRDYSLLIASRLYGQRLKAGAATLNNRKSGFSRRHELKGEVSLDHIRCVHHVLLSRVLLRTVLSSRADKNIWRENECSVIIIFEQLFLSSKIRTFV